ncbi:glycosyltransferase family 2 protein [Candidatus Falkowbacteria bacterium]|nr:glycosyltransferase family 2 protein [Candidatus Falkowbacteria bacterium]
MKNRLSVIIINYNTAEMTERAVRNFLEKEKGLDAEIILIDNGSKEKLDAEKFSRLGANPHTKIDVGIKLIMNKENLGFAKAANQGMMLATGDYILLLNSDVFVKEGAIGKMVKYMEDHLDIAVLGPRFYNIKGDIQPSAGYSPNLLRELMRLLMLSKVFPGGTLVYKNIFTERFFNQASEVGWVSGGCMLIRREALKKTGLLDENYFFGVEDMDFCARQIQAGSKVVYFPEAEIMHYHGFSSGGRGSLFSLRHEKIGMTYFFKKFFPGSKLSLAIISALYDLKIKILD